MLTALLLMIALLLAAAAWIIWQASILFSLEIVDGKPRARRGDVPMHFEHTARDVARRYGIQRGRVTAMRTREGARLRASGSIPREAQGELQTALKRIKLGRRKRRKRR
ncbi:MULTISPECIES: DUF3634 family protein [unclassified Thioalkalivibrio]|uniref:DUF3634 family protein n=1 Tax=unclassified Thioalkalivibrio TaxID=2621013 RepID=UPI0004783CF8|nr:MULTISPECIES: DUF3634 family protein [unclassified Thioalkalivibrio]